MLTSRKLNQISGTDIKLGGLVPERAAYTDHLGVLCSKTAFICQDYRPVTRAGEAIMKSEADRSPGIIGTFSVASNE
jgi:hypothetical protein